MASLSPFALPWCWLSSRCSPSRPCAIDHALYRGDDTRARRARFRQAAAIGVATALACVAIDAHADGSNFRGFASLEGQVGIPSGPLAQDLGSVTPGFQIACGMGPRSLPILFGVAAGVLVLDQSSGSKQWAATVDGDDFYVANYAYSQSLEIRHLELLARVEPDFPWVRPFAEVSVGAGALWISVHDAEGDGEQQQDVALTRGWALGLDLDPWGPRHRRSGNGGFVLTLGVRSFDTGSLQYLRTVPGSGDVRAGGPFHAIAPYIALTVAGWS